MITCPPRVLEYCHLATTAAEYHELREDLDELLAAWAHPGASAVPDIQPALWDSGLMRAAAAFDCLIAAHAVANEANVLDSDQDFGSIEEATGGTVHQEHVVA